MHVLTAQPNIGGGRLQDLGQEEKKALLVGTYTRDKETCVEQLNELESLGNTYGLQTVLKIACPIRAYDAGTFIGSGKVEEIQSLAIQHGCSLVVFDDEISLSSRGIWKSFWRGSSLTGPS